MNVSTSHPSLKKVFKECLSWWDRLVLKGDRLDREVASLREELDATGTLTRAAIVSCHSLGHTYGIRACIAFGITANTAFDGLDLLPLPEALRWAVAFRSLAFRFEAAVPAKSETRLPLSFWSSMEAAGPAMLSLWEEARSCARWLIDVAHRDQAVISEDWRKHSWGKGTNDAFLIFLFSQAFGLSTHYRSVNPLIPAYKELLDCWRTSDKTAFQQAMQAAAEFHISRSKHGTDKNKYEFESDFDRVFPAELLAVQALRRRDGLPEFETGHALVDTPWAVIRDLPEAEPHPLAVAVEARLRHDYPQFR
ncbi:hypothetical protein [Xanthomonas fragariae]|uniref:hypothetical protein n=1 Tax=Xanthomonas fragariae TaxID=48664 RepID=UPI0022AA9386|nr:hypothetical protein [Xanthomonas fragariae]WAT15709.1 hypothetical protein OZ429_04735 [Xanthomonas fragariae]